MSRRTPLYSPPRCAETANIGASLALHALLALARGASGIEGLAARAYLLAAPLLMAHVARLVLSGEAGLTATLLTRLVCSIVDCPSLADVEDRGLHAYEIVELAALAKPYNSHAIRASRLIWRMASVGEIPVGRGEWPRAKCPERISEYEVLEWAAMPPQTLEAVVDDAGLSIWYRPGCLERIVAIVLGLRFSTRSSPA